MFIQPKTFRGYKEALPKTFHTFPDSFENGDFPSIRFSLLSIPYVNSQFLGTKEAGYQTQSLEWSFFLKTPASLLGVDGRKRFRMR